MHVVILCDLKLEVESWMTLSVRHHVVVTAMVVAVAIAVTVDDTASVCHLVVLDVGVNGGEAGSDLLSLTFLGGFLCLCRGLSLGFGLTLLELLFKTRVGLDPVVCLWGSTDY
jgi:hypothetical protein